MWAAVTLSTLDLTKYFLFFFHKKFFQEQKKHYGKNKVKIMIKFLIVTGILAEFTKFPRDVILIKNQKLKFECENGNFTDFRWTKNGNLFEKNGKIFEIENVREENEGDYNCIAEGPDGSVISPVGKVQVIGKFF